MTVIKFPTLCEGCGKQASKCACLTARDRRLWDAIRSIDLSKGYTVEELIDEIERKVNDE